MIKKGGNMKCNVGKIDRIIRIVISLIFAVLGYITKLWVFYILGGILLLTAITGFCILYLPFKINTCNKK
ncbi:MAG: Uncharacterized protein XD76_1091 [candidate division TA06 bacterium 32_111]|uniref:Inner membrane protein YgaP-like transmembrane domain-containing protein n=2 Tax=Bacteria candidate phyla TaxID=1783234 RepID=A0A124G0E2_UNCT6|nr:MAG: Uncharacterized protein XD76_1091 [candidate division TA06 bacterium 32_111]KUK87235.1 MAG: Uncharacterized protein XE03_0843 [candidate division TA06 bacterium 34_109]